MKIISLIIGIMTFFAVPALAADLKIVCDWVESGTVDKYAIVVNSVETPAEIEEADGKVRLNYTVADSDLPPGWNTVKAKAGNEIGQWSGWSEELRFHNGVFAPKIRFVIEILP